MGTVNFKEEKMATNAEPIVYTSLYPAYESLRIGQTVDVNGRLLAVASIINIGRIDQDRIDDEDMFEFEGCDAIEVGFRAATESEASAIEDAKAEEQRAADQAAADLARRQAEFDAFRAGLGNGVMFEHGRKATVGGTIFVADGDLDGAWNTTGDVYRSGVTISGRPIVVRYYGNAAMAYGDEEAMREIVTSNLPALDDMPQELAVELLADLAHFRGGSDNTDNCDAELVVSSLGGERALADHIRKAGVVMVTGLWAYGNSVYYLEKRSAQLKMLDELEVPYVEMANAGEADWDQYVKLAEAGVVSDYYVKKGKSVYDWEYASRETLYRAPNGDIYIYVHELTGSGRRYWRWHKI
ncbi:hypothetical protein [Deinococcus fonticola]|uniref:hypothetical protein n=1 Tax=Deinococcus fonticola TaxID=2528713 RepID=UPI001074BFAF|nr:hypothetical protein [Deinococcus fonticola]